MAVEFCLINGRHFEVASNRAIPAIKVAQNMLRKTAKIHHPNSVVRAKYGEQL